MENFSVKRFYLIVCFCLGLTGAFAQENIPVFGRQKILSGYQKSLTGEEIPYFSSYPQFATHALLSRCTDGNSLISWQTDNAPEKLSEKYCYFAWLGGHSCFTSGDNRRFRLMINGVEYLTFTTPAKKAVPFVWNFSGKDSVALVFEATDNDVHKDAFGKMFLRVPKQLLAPGKPLTLSIAGEKQDSYDWMMVFKYSFTQKIELKLTPFILNTAVGNKQELLVYVDHMSSDIKQLEFSINKKTQLFPVKKGFNCLQIPIDTVTKPTSLEIEVKLNNQQVYHHTLIQRPVARREVDIIHHTHNDIGYSHLQSEVMKIQYQNILDALDLIDKTKDYPEGSKFVWNVETLWPVEYFVKHAPAKDLDRLKLAVKNRSMVITGFYVGVMTGLSSPEELLWIAEYADTLRKNYHFPIDAAMMTDIPGFSWSVADMMVKHNIKYLSNGPNYISQMPDKGDRIGATLRELGDKPFYWKTTDGKEQVLVWTAGLGYSAFHQIADVKLGEKMKEKLIWYLNDLDSAGYPYDMVQLRYTIKSDNGPADKRLSDFVRNWNIQYASPKLVIAGVSDMMNRFESKYASKIPVFSGDFTPYWEDGAYSTAYEEGRIRMLSDYILQLEKISENKKMKPVNPIFFYEARKSIVMFNEHTWGAWNSISSPDDPFATVQWANKRAFLDSAQFYIRQIEKQLFEEDKTGQIEVINTLGFTRSQYVEFSMPKNRSLNSLKDENGIFYPVQKLANGSYCFIARDIPANGSKKFIPVMNKIGVSPKVSMPAIKIDSVTGAIQGFMFEGREMVLNNQFHGLNQAVYVKGTNPENFSLSKVINLDTIENGNVRKTIRVTCTLDGCKSLIYEYTVFNHLDYIQCKTIVNKIAVREKESFHIAFPFNMENPVNRVGISDTFFIPGLGQIPGSNKNFYSVQRWIDVSNNEVGVTLCAPQTALIEIGKITDERPVNNGYRKWMETIMPSSTLFAYAMNNYWGTNFKADQEGVVEFDSYLFFHKQFELNKSKAFGESIHAPFVVRWVE